MDSLRPNLLISKDWLYIIELTVGFETDLRNNLNRKMTKYKDLIEQKKQYNNVNFINLSMGTLVVVDEASNISLACYRN